jgi:2-polyprenyl-6-methoxyphenol hydroxylase-like FAD-dependent oxidoreductase
MQVARIIVLGAGVCGLTTGILLRRDGHDVTVLERDAEPAPDSIEDAVERWSREGVSQFRQAHLLTPRGREVLEEALPDALAGVRAAGGQQLDLLALIPPRAGERKPRDDDHRFETVGVRRAVLEQVLGRMAADEPGLELRRGVSVREPVVRARDGTPHVTGVRIDSGEELGADLVVDAMGRRSQLPRWLEQAGAMPMLEESEDSGFIYYTRFFQDTGAGMPPFRGPVLTPIGSFSLLTIPADNGTWSVTVYISSGDRPLKRLRHVGAWEALVGACPLHAQWLEGEPITDVIAMGGVVDRYRRLIVDGQPVATGIVPVGDAWACSNPSLGRGMTLGLMHVQLLREAIGEHLDEPRQLVEAFDLATEDEVTPWYRETVEEDRGRAREIAAFREGRDPEPDSEDASLRRALLAAVGRDPDVLRAFIASRCCLTTVSETLADRAFAERVIELARDAEAPPLAGPNREQVLQLIDGVAIA